jgi:hypothetical protein
MDRRRYLGALTAGIGTLAGCSSGGEGADVGTETGEPTDSPTPTAGSDAEGLPVPESELERGAGKNAIPAITDPVFAEHWSDVSYEVESRLGESYTAEPEMRGSDRVIGVARGDAVRAYPLKVLNWHEVVNDTFDGPLLVTYCPLCGSAVTAVRQAGDQMTTFGVSGLLYKQDLVMYDEATESLWSQIEARAIRGELTGERLELVPSTLTTWGEWTAAYPGSLVLRPPPESGTVVGEVAREYHLNPYEGYDDSERIGISGETGDTDPVHPKAMVVGVTDGDAARAYPLEAVEEAGVVNDEVGDLPVIVTVAARETLVAYDRRVDGETLAFERDGEVLVAGGSRWNPMTGEAVDGPYGGTALAPANERSPMFFFAWESFNPETDVYGAGNG